MTTYGINPPQQYGIVRRERGLAAWNHVLLLALNAMMVTALIIGCQL